MYSLWRSKRLVGIAATGLAVAVPLSLGMAPAALAAPAPAIKVTQNSSDDIVTNDGIACSSNDTGFVSDNQYYRRFDLSQYGAANGFTVSKMTAGVEIGDSSDGNVPGDFVIYAMDHSVGADFTVADLGAPLATVPVNLFTATGNALISAPITAAVPAGKDMVIEVAVDEATGDQSFYPGANEAAETGTTYLTSAGCGITDPTSLADIGFDGLSNVFWVNGKKTECLAADAAEAKAEAAITTAKAGVTTATAAVTTATATATKAASKLKKAKAKLKKAKKSHQASKIKKAKAKVKKAKKANAAAKSALASANTALTAANTALSTANAALAPAQAAQTAACAQPALPTPRPTGSGHGTKPAPKGAFSLTHS